VLYLIKKDILMQKKTIGLSLFVILLFSFTLSPMGTAGFAVSTLAVTYMLMLGASALEEKTNSDMMLVSLPIKKRTIVLSKYVSVYVYAAYAVLANVLIHFIADVLHMNSFGFPVTWQGVLGAVVAVSFFASVSFPLIFKYGYMKSRMANYVVLFGMVFGGTALVKYLTRSVDLGFLRDVSGGGWVGGIVPTALLVVLSCVLSLRFYKNREF